VKLGFVEPCEVGDGLHGCPIVALGHKHFSRGLFDLVRRGFLEHLSFHAFNHMVEL